MRSRLWRYAISLLVTAGISTASISATEADSPWRLETHGARWQIRLARQPDYRTGAACRAIVVSLPGNTVVEPIAHARARCVLSDPPTGKLTLSFNVSDSFVGPTAGHIFTEAHVDGRAVFSADVAGGQTGPRRVEVRLDGDRNPDRTMTIALGVWLRKTVSNFPIRVVYSDVVLSTPDGRCIRLSAPAVSQPLDPLPPDLPMPTAAPMGGWPITARVVQPWGSSQAFAVKQHAVWARRLADEFAFNAIIMLPPDAHNAITADRDAKNAAMRITEREFAEAVEAYRACGLRLILYTSIMHCGHAPIWQTGRLGETHPEWNQVDADGTPILTYGAPWLCPSTPALDFAIDYTRGLIERWRPDAVMLDNNQFYLTAEGAATCHCEHCQRRFREYVGARFGPDRARRLLGVDDLAALRIPTTEGVLFSVWKHWRNRVWGEATERFRAAMRRKRPDVVVLANTQYLYSSWVLATDMQYAHEDAVLAESRGLSSAAMSDKMLLGQALGRGRPLWNYLGTFAETDYERLRPAGTIESIAAASLANGARPWIVFYGFREPSPALTMLGGHMRLARRWLDASKDARRWTDVVALFSVRPRNHLGGALMPSCLDDLRRAQIAVEPLRDVHLPRFDLTRYAAVIADGIACLSNEEARVLADWVKRGGTLLASPDVGWYDEIGRLRSTSALSDLLGVRPPGTHAVGRGRVVWCGSGAEIVAAIKAHAPLRLTLDHPDADWELVAYRQTKPEQFWIHAVNHGKPTDVAPHMIVALPTGTRVKSANWLTAAGDTDAAVEQDSHKLRVTLPARSRYAILRIAVGG